MNNMDLERIWTIKRMHDEGAKNDTTLGLGLKRDGIHPDRTIDPGRDDGRVHLHEARFLRAPLTEPKVWCHHMPKVRQPIIRTLPLESAGGMGQVSDQTIEDCHSRCRKLTLKQFNRGNRNIAGKPKTETLKSEDGSVKRFFDFDWETPQSLNNIQEACCNYCLIWQQFWPLDPTPITFMRLLIRYKWIGSGQNMVVRIEIICQLFEYITTTNGSRANNDIAPLTYDEQEK